MDSKPIRLVGYVRASTAKQENTTDVQRERLIGFSRVFDHTLVAIVEDPAKSAKALPRHGKRRAPATLDALLLRYRPRLAEALSYIERGEADGLIVSKLDRLTRSIRDFADFVEVYFHKDGARLLSVGDQIDTATASGRMVLNMLVNVSQWERERIGERTSEVLQHKRASGEYTGGAPPYGWRVRQEGDRKILAPDPFEQGIIVAARIMHDDGFSLRAIAATLTARGSHPRGKDRQWHPKTIQDLIDARLAEEVDFPVT